MKRVIDMCPFMGLAWADDEGKEHKRGEGLTPIEKERLDGYFSHYTHTAFNRDKAIELAQMALDDVPIPKGWMPT